MIVNTNPKGDLTNALIHFDPIKGLAVGFVIAYPLPTPLGKGGALGSKVNQCDLFEMIFRQHLWRYAKLNKML